jgi:hypothetical protein
MISRPESRIPTVLDALYQAWRRQPDWRLGQLVTNAAGQQDLFVVEDTEWPALFEAVPPAAGGLAPASSGTPAGGQHPGLGDEAVQALRTMATPFDVEGLAAVLERLRSWDQYAAATWLSAPNPILAGSRPIEVAGRNAESVLQAIDAVEAQTPRS